jgi:site-specific recombinase XerD
VTQLRKMMLQELQRRNYSKATVRTYLMAVRQFAEYFHRSQINWARITSVDFRVIFCRRRSSAPAASCNGFPHCDSCL